MRLSNREIDTVGEILRSGSENDTVQAIELLNQRRYNLMLSLQNFRAVIDAGIKKELIVLETLKNRLLQKYLSGFPYQDEQNKDLHNTLIEVQIR